MIIHRNMSKFSDINTQQVVDFKLLCLSQQKLKEFKILMTFYFIYFNNA